MHTAHDLAPPVVVFAGEGLTACDNVKAWLSHKGVGFTTRNVDDDDAAYDALVATGYRTVPLTIIGTQTVVGYVPDALLAALTAAGLAPAE